MAKIFVVDDAPNIRRVVQPALQAKEHEVLMAASKEEGYEAAIAESPDRWTAFRDHWSACDGIRGIEIRTNRHVNLLNPECATGPRSSRSTLAEPIASARTANTSSTFSR